jgi:DNA-binding transcriptional LysR family regulator
VFPPFGSSAAQPLELYLLQSNIRPKRRVVETVSYSTILRLLDSTDCVAILPQHLARAGERNNTLSIIGPALQQGGLPIGLTYRSDHPLSPLGRSLAEAFRQAARNIAD